MGILFIICNDIVAKLFENPIKELKKDSDVLALRVDKFFPKREKKLNNILIDYPIDVMSYGKDVKYYDINDFLVKNSINVIVVTHDMTLPIERYFIDSAKKLGIKSVTVQEAFFTGDEKYFSNKINFNLIDNLKFLKLTLKCYNLSELLIYIHYKILDTLNGTPKQFGFGNCDLIIVFGSYLEKKLIELGINATKIHIVGNPIYDNIINSNIEKIDRTKNENSYICKNNKDEKQRIVLLTTQPVVPPIFFIDNIVLPILKEISDLFVIIKIHPSEEYNDYNRIIDSLEDKYKEQIIIFDQENIFNTIQLSDILITMWSTTAIDAMLLKKPIIIFNHDKNSPSIIFTKYNASVLARNPTELINNIFLFYSDSNKQYVENQAKFLYEFVYKTDGKSSIRLAKLLKNLDYL